MGIVTPGSLSDAAQSLACENSAKLSQSNADTYSEPFNE